ncbi:MAG TPA: hypothetical protein VGM88_25780 [Kofleriaceae bacterium]
MSYLPGRVRCPLAGVGAQAADASNRLVVEDATAVELAGDTITLHDDRAYATKTVVADLVWLAEGPAPFTIHVEIFKTGHAWSIELHTHEPVPLADRKRASYEPLTIVAVDGARREVLVDRDRLARAVTHVPLSRRLSGALTTTRDHALAPGVVLDRSIGIGALGRGMFLIRARLSQLGDAPPRSAGLAAMLAGGAWELSLEALTERWLPELVARDLVLFGFADVPLLAGLRDGTLRRGQTLAFRTTGEVRLDDATAPLPGALDVARAYLEFHMLGGMIAAALR